MPSFYALVFFTGGYVLYLSDGELYERGSPELHAVCLLAIGAFSAASWWYIPAYARLAPTLDRGPGPSGTRWSVIVLLHVLGLAGIVQYLLRMADYFGSVSAVLLRLVTTGSDIRLAAPEVTTLGTQLSYLGWIAIWLTALQDGRGARRAVLLLLAVIQIAANLLFVDRTRPIWILFVFGLLIAVRRFGALTTRRLLTAAGAAAGAFLLLFVLIGAWVGKISFDLDAVAAILSSTLESINIYLSSAYAYLGRVLLEEPDGNLSRSLYPIESLAARFDLMLPPPSQINEFISTPVPTNVGTFIEPLFRDGGISLILVGVWLHAFGANWLGGRMLSTPRALCLITWALLCFVDAVAFFTPKYTNTPTWLVLIAGLIAWRLHVRAARLVPVTP